MRALLIDPLERRITEVEHTGKLAELYETLQCSVVEAVTLPDGSTLWIDEEGKLRGDADGNRRTDCFYIASHVPDYSWDCVGRALVLGPPDQYGDETPATLTVAEVEAMVEWSDTYREPEAHFVPWIHPPTPMPDVPAWTPCSPGCDGWHLMDSGIEACDEAGRFKRDGVLRDDLAIEHVRGLGVDPTDPDAVFALQERLQLRALQLLGWSGRLVQDK